MVYAILFRAPAERWRTIAAVSDSPCRPTPAHAGDRLSRACETALTPIHHYREMGPYRLATRGEGRYAAPDGAYAYLEVEVREVSTEFGPDGFE